MSAPTHSGLFACSFSIAIILFACCLLVACKGSGGRPGAGGGSGRACLAIFAQRLRSARRYARRALLAPFSGAFRCMAPSSGASRCNGGGGEGFGGRLGAGGDSGRACSAMFAGGSFSPSHRPDSAHSRAPGVAGALSRGVPVSSGPPLRLPLVLQERGLSWRRQVLTPGATFFFAPVHHRTPALPHGGTAA